MNQSRKSSLLEAVVNVVVDFEISLGAQFVVFPWFGILVDARTNIQIGGCFTAVSLARAYFLRRLFNWWVSQPIEPRYKAGSSP